MTTPYAALTPTQAAVYVALTASSTLMSMISGVYDGEAPEGAAFPYIVIGDSTETADNAHGAFGRQTVQTLHVWSSYRGNAEANAIVGLIQELIDHQPLTITGARWVSTRFEFSQTLTDPDRPALRHAPIRFRITTSKD